MMPLQPSRNSSIGLLSFVEFSWALIIVLLFPRAL